MELKSPPPGKLTYWNKSPVVKSETPKRRRSSNGVSPSFQVKRTILPGNQLISSGEGFANEVNTVSVIDLGKLKNENVLAASLIIKFGLEIFQSTILALRHVPESFPDRGKYVLNIVKVYDEGNTLDVKQFKESIHLFERLLHKSKTDSAAEKNFINTLWKATNDNGEPYLNFLVPNVSICLNGNCGGTLYPCEKAQVTVFKLTGPEPGLKSSLRCRSCDARYHLGCFTVPNQGRSFYTEHNQSQYKSASTRQIFSSDTYNFMCESG